MQLYGANRPILGEKTPSHLFHVPTLLEWFPNTRIIHTFRDPRAIFVSESMKQRRLDATRAHSGRCAQARAPSFSPVLPQVTLTWTRCAHLHRKYTESYPDRYRLLKFEDLTQYPETQLELLSGYLGIDLTPLVLDNLTSNSSFTDRRDKPGIDSGAADRWKTHIKPWADRWFRLCCGKQLEQFGYA